MGQVGDCAPDSDGNRRNPAGQDTVWGSRGWECSSKIEKPLKKKNNEDVAVYMKFWRWYVGNKK